MFDTIWQRHGCILLTNCLKPSNGFQDGANVNQYMFWMTFSWRSEKFFCNRKLTWFYSDIGCCCYSFCCINRCIFADDTGYSSCEYSQLSVNRGHLRKMDISLRRTPGVGPCRFSVILQWREQCSSSLRGGPLQRFLRVSWEVRQYNIAVLVFIHHHKTLWHYPPTYTIDLPGSLYDGFLSQICWKGGKS